MLATSLTTTTLFNLKLIRLLLYNLIVKLMLLKNQRISVFVSMVATTVKLQISATKLHSVEIAGIQICNRKPINQKPMKSKPFHHENLFNYSRTSDSRALILGRRLERTISSKPSTPKSLVLTARSQDTKTQIKTCSQDHMSQKYNDPFYS